MPTSFTRIGLRSLAGALGALLFATPGCNPDEVGSGEIIISRVAVRISVTGEGGSVRSADPAFECAAAACSQQIVRGTQLHLLAVPQPNARFLGWSGACSGTDACDVVADKDLDVGAAFSTAPPAALDVTVQVEGEGDIRSTPAGIDCGATCNATFPAGVTVTLAPTPRPGFLFSGWSGACSGRGACTLGPAVDASLALSVKATFLMLAPDRRGITVAVVGNGSVRSNPAGIDCGATCSASFPEGTALELVATPAGGARFTGWSGACSGSGACALTLNADAQVTATFEAIAPVLARLSVIIGGDGAGRVSSSPAGIDCAAPGCSASFVSGTVVQLTPSADAGSLFGGWALACSGAAACSVTLDRDLSVSASFVKQPPPPPVFFTLTVTRTGTGSGRLVSTPGGIDCGATCSGSFASGASVTLTQIADPGSTFESWGGACVGKQGCSVTMDRDLSVSASFAKEPPPPPPSFTLTVAQSGRGIGRVTSSPAGIDCGSACSASFATGTLVTLTAVADPGYRFLGWSGPCSGTAACGLTIDRDFHVTAVFDEVLPPPPTSFTLTVQRTGAGTGRVDSSPAGIACGDTCSASFDSGTAITLTQHTSSGSTFTGWGGACSDGGACSLTLSSDATVTANFDLLPPAGISIYITHSDPSHNLLAVAPDGTAYGTSHNDESAAVYASTDDARTWSRRGRASARVVRMTALSDGVLLADVSASGSTTIERSGDGGRTWTQVLSMGTSRTLSPHSFDERNGVVYLGEYQTATQSAVPIRLWSSADRGRTWGVVHTFTEYTHAHAVRVDPDSGAIWMFMGDRAMSSLIRSTDGGSSWQTMLTGESQARVVDAVFTPSGLLYGLDVSPPLSSGVLRLSPDGLVTRLANLPEPSYSIHAMRGGGYLLGTTREPRDVYPNGEENTYIFGSPDGAAWTQVARFPRIDPGEYANADVYWELASGEAVIHLYNVEPMWSGEAYMLAAVSIQ